MSALMLRHFSLTTAGASSNIAKLMYTIRSIIIGTNPTPLNRMY